MRSPPIYKPTRLSAVDTLATSALSGQVIIIIIVDGAEDIAGTGSSDDNSRSMQEPGQDEPGSTAAVAIVSSSKGEFWNWMGPGSVSEIESASKRWWARRILLLLLL
jgi:hypothetical protein